jgi:hypothetical protein
MIVLADKLAFIGHPRTASRATARALKRAGCDDIGNHHDVVKGEYDKEIVACTVRNPFDIVVSWYFNWHYDERGKRHRACEFDTWVMGGCKSVDYMKASTYFYGLRHANRVLRFETLEADLERLMLDCGLEPVATEPYGVLKRDRDYRVYYNDRTRDAIEKKFARDFELTGYKF